VKRSAQVKKLDGMALVYERICQILESARANVARSVNTTQVIANWLIGREIVEEEQRGRRKAKYGAGLIVELATKLQQEFNGGYSATNLKLFRQFYVAYPELIPPPIGHALCDQLALLPAQSVTNTSQSGSGAGHTACDQSWIPGRLHPNLGWSLYRHLVRVDKPEARAFYEIEATQNSWSARELERQINSLLYERLALSKDKQGLLRLAKKGQEIAAPIDVFKDPVVIEFLGLPESPRLAETELEQALIDNLQAFLLELGKGFAFVARQERLTLDGDHFYIDLVFYHTVLKCFVLIDLKTGKLTHQDLGQLQLYVNYYDHERRTEGDNPTLGLILCTDKNDTVVKYTLAADQSPKIFASRYKLYLPSEAELANEIRREVRQLPSATPALAARRPSGKKRKKS
jgi:predicted nuclease of restriction endonuclease-like (RecB) superfamily